MDNQEYRIKGKEIIDFIGDYLRDIRTQRVFPNVTPGYMRKLLPDHAPIESEPWDDIMNDIKTVILPGVTHWQSPYMHAYFPALNSYPSLLGDMIADAINCLGFTWASSPACTELETIVMDWLGKMIGLPSDFLHSNTATSGGGVIQTTASEATFISILAARTEAIRKVQEIYPEKDDSEINGRLIAYCSDQAHSSVEKAGLIGLVRMRYLASDDELSLRGETLRDAILEDREAGFIPFYLCASLGTTGACAFDNLAELGPICQDEEIYLHIDAAYSGTAFICPEYRYLMKGVEYAQSFAFNPSKWLMVHFDCTAMWIKDSRLLHRTFNVDPLYLKHENSGEAIDYMHWQIGLSKRFRALKLWCVLRSFGVKGLQNHIKRGIELAKMFENFVLSNPNFEIPAKRYLGMIVFRLKGENELTETLLKALNSSGQLHMVPASLKGTYIIRFTVTSQFTTEEDIKRDWNIIMLAAREVVIKQGGLWIEEIEEDIEVEVSEDESGLGEELQYIGKDTLSGESDTVPTESDSIMPMAFKKGIIKKSKQPEEGVKGTMTGIEIPGAPGERVSTSMVKIKRTKIIPRKQMSVVFDPRASARRRATAVAASNYVPNVTKIKGVDIEEGEANGANLSVKRGSNFGLSLLLSNTPHSPQFINGSYAAIFENPQVVDDIASHLRRLQTEYSPWRQGPPPAKAIECSLGNLSHSKIDTNLVTNITNLRENSNELGATIVNDSESYADKTDDGNQKSRSSIMFKKAIENLYGTYDLNNDSIKQGSDLSSNLLRKGNDSCKTAFKRFAPGRQFSLDSRLNFYSRAISDISAAAKAAIHREGGSLKPQRREFISRNKHFDKTSEVDNEEADDEPETPSQQDVTTPPNDVNGPEATEDFSLRVRAKVEEESISTMSKDEENDQAPKLMVGASLRRRRRIIDPPTHVPALPKGGISSFLHGDLAKASIEKIMPMESIGVQVEESMLPFEDQPYSSPFITAPNYIGRKFDHIEEPCEKNFKVSDNEKMVEVNVDNNKGPWAKIKKKLVRTGTKSELGESKDLEWESIVPNSNKFSQNDACNTEINLSPMDNNLNLNIKKSFSNGNLSKLNDKIMAHKNYSDYNSNNNNINEFNEIRHNSFYWMYNNSNSEIDESEYEGKLPSNEYFLKQGDSTNNSFNPNIKKSVLTGNLNKQDFYLDCNRNNKNVGEFNINHYKCDVKVDSIKLLKQHEIQDKNVITEIAENHKKDSFFTKLAKLVAIYTDTNSYIKSAGSRDSIHGSSNIKHFSPMRNSCRVFKERDKLRRISKKDSAKCNYAQTKRSCLKQIQHKSMNFMPLMEMDHEKLIYPYYKMTQSGVPSMIDENNNIYLECENCGHKMVPGPIVSANLKQNKINKVQSSSLALL